MSGMSQRQPLKLQDLDRVTLKSSQAFRALGRFLRTYVDQTNGKGDIATICADVEIEGDHMSSDPAALSDWQECVMAVLAEDGK